MADIENYVMLASALWAVEWTKQNDLAEIR